MTKLSTSWTAVARLTCAAVTICAMSGAMAKVEGVTGTAFTLVAKSGYISIADGASIYNWGYALRNADGSANFQYPGPTLIVNQGDVVEITLINELPTNVSLLFPGQIDITTAQISNADAPSGCTASGNANKTDVGRITVEARPRGCLKYRFVASRPGTYTYHSGTQMPVQLEMGLFGALIVRPKDAPGQAYEHAGTRFDREHLMMLSEVDPVWHEAIRAQAEAVQLPNQNGSFRWYVNMSGFATRNPLYWFINGRTGPDTMNGSFVPELPAQPYNALPRMHPGERLLVRTINAGRDLHPFHHHGNNTWTLGVDGRMLASGPATGPDLARSDNTLRMVPGQTVDAIYEWTGKGLNWDAYGVGDGHTCNGVSIEDAAAVTRSVATEAALQANGGFDPVTREYCPDHGKPLPTVIPSTLEMTFGDVFSGSPYLGSTGGVPVGAGRLGSGGAYFHMWHSHNEREIINNGIFPGGMMTFVVIEPQNVPID